jgi:hypothetical protein
VSWCDWLDPELLHVFWRPKERKKGGNRSCSNPSKGEVKDDGGVRGGRRHEEIRVCLCEKKKREEVWEERRRGKEKVREVGGDRYCHLPV